LLQSDTLVKDRGTADSLEGVAAVRAIARQVPLYWPLLPLLWWPPIARRADADARGCRSP
jgi:hypothetical protein